MSRSAPRRGVAVTRWFLPLCLIAGGALYGGACSRETLVGIDAPPPGSGGFHGLASGGFYGSGSGGEVGPGSGGSGVSNGPPTCPVISTTPGQVNECGRTSGVAFSPDGTLLAAVSDDAAPYLRVWRLSDGHQLYQPATPENRDGAFGVTFSPDGKLIATAGWAASTFTNGNQMTTNTNAVNIWDAATGSRITSLPTHCGPYASGVAFSHDGTLLVTTGQNSPIEVWNVADWSEARMIQTPTNETTYEAAFSPDDKRLITSGGAGVNRIWNTADGTEVAEITGVVAEQNRAAYSPNGQLIFGDAAGGQIQILDATASTLQVMTFSSGPAPQPYIGHSAWIDDSHLLADDWAGTVEEWSKDPAQPEGTFTLQHTWNMPSQALGIAVAPDHASFVVAGQFGFVVVTP